MLDAVIGQGNAVRYLRKVVDGQIKSPLLLVGDEGTGRKFSVIQAIKEVMAQKTGSTGTDIAQVTHNAHPDVTLVSSVDDKDLGIDPIREVISKSEYSPIAAPYRFFIIDGADRLTPAAANALLKTIEEPPSFSRFFLLAESFDRVIPTIRSRCGRVDFQRLPESFIVERISKFETNPDKALVYARIGEGSVGRASRYFGSNRLVFRDRVLNFLQLSANGDLSSSFEVIDGLLKELSLALRFLVFLVHDLMVLNVDPDRVINMDLLEDLSAMRLKLNPSTLMQLWSELRVVWERNESSYVNLPFQLKSTLASVFARV